MTRVSVYVGSLLISVAATALTLTAIILPQWISYTSGPVHFSYGLHKRCTSSGICSPFPQQVDCAGDDRYFCSMWRTIGFLMSFALVMAGVVMAAHVAVMSGGRQKREEGWKMVSILLMFQALSQAVAISLVSYLFDNDERFFVGWKLDVSFILATISWSASFILAVLLGLSAVMLPSEEGYEFLRD